MIDGPSQFDFYSGGGLHIAFLGFGEIDRHGHVNVSKLGGSTVGPGGFIDIAQNARKVVFCGTFDAKGTNLAFGPNGLTIHSHGEVAPGHDFTRDTIQRIGFTPHIFAAPALMTGAHFIP